MRAIVLSMALIAGGGLAFRPAPALADDSKAPPTPGDTRSAAGSDGSGKATAGWVLLGVGGALTVGGIVVDVVGAGKTHVSGSGGPGDTSTTQDARTNLLWAGSTMIVAGVLLGIAGGSFLVAASKQAPATAAAADTSVPGGGSDPVDPVTKAVQAALDGAPSFVVPIVGARF
jgi:hypothetical protein